MGSFDSIAENLRVLGPVFAVIWILTVALTLLFISPILYGLIT